VLSYHRLRLTLTGVIVGWAIINGAHASASGTVVIRPGDSLDGFARKFHVTKKDIAAANGIAVEALLRDGTTLRIPDPPRHVIREATMRQPAVVTGDRVSVRLGPYQAYHRLTLLDHGASIVVTHRAGNWLQVAMPDSGIGWVREEYIAFDRTEAERRNDARHIADRPRSSERRVARRDTDDDDDRPVRSRRRHRRTEVASSDRRHHHSQRTAEGRRRSQREAAIHGRRWRPEATAPRATTDVIRTAYAYRGVRYRYSGASPGGFDCSGFTSYLYRRKGVALPHSAAEQFHQGRRVENSRLKPGDLVFFHTTSRGISHVGIYAGDGRFVHASSARGRVRVDSLNSGYYRSRFRGARRVK
jgi:cell wall-associated NlpC family hydrolase/LysM repeat protein